MVQIGPSDEINTTRAQEDDDIMEGRWAVPVAESPASWQSYISLGMYSGQTTLFVTKYLAVKSNMLL